MNQFAFKNDDADTEIVTFMSADPHYFTTDNCLLYMETPHKPDI